MNIIQRIAKNTGVLFISQIGSYILTFLFSMYTARYLGAKGFGILSFAVAFTEIFYILSDLGLGILTVREVARDKFLAKKYIGNIAIMKVILVVVTFGLIVLFTNLLGYPKQTRKVVYFVSSSIIFNTFSNLFYFVFQAYEQMEYQSLGQIMRSALILFFALFGISQGFSVVGFASIYFIVSAVILVYTFSVCVWKLGLPKIEIDLSFCKQAIKEALPFGLSNIFIAIYYWISSILLSLMKGDEVVGWYNAAYKMILILLFIPSPYFTAIFPLMSRFFKTSEDLLKFTLSRSSKYMMIIGVPVGIGITLLADKIILLVFGVEYTPSIIVLQILIWGVVFAFITIPFENLFYSINKQYIVTIEVGIAAMLNVILNLLLIPKYSLIGAGIATTATWLFGFLFIIICVSKTEHKIPISHTLNITLKIIVSGLAMLVFILYSNINNLLIILMLSALIYLSFLYIIKGFDKEDIIIINKLFKSKQRVDKDEGRGSRALE